jgi:hypothetical protein
LKKQLTIDFHLSAVSRATEETVQHIAYGAAQHIQMPALRQIALSLV